ncbi:Leukotoxin [Ascidiaceihabitans donghaensis]|uniref:Leukotoxin n=1 Tax=Ascidiaceihabitans donghaensis TaxID=1510460 RepID=A0A2R8BCT7_9RHOB|nr:calcium-binding protein [Ascidiaceihabitans donghaensis]SPH20840.1 Leukotoxin [Ascidiaceihabitans donghaensis]
MTLRFITTDQTNTSIGGEIINSLGSPNLTVGTGDEVIVFENVTLAADGSLLDVTGLDDFDMIMNGDGFAGSNAFRIDYSSSLGEWDFEVSLSIGNDATITTNTNLSFFGVLATGSTYLQDGSEFRFNNAGTTTAMQGRGFEFQTIVDVQAANSGTVTVGEGPGFVFESIVNADFTNTGTIISVQNSNLIAGNHLTATVAFNSFVENVQFVNTGTVTGNAASLISGASVSENITNTGTLAGDVYTSAAVGGTLINSGQILGDLFTQNGDDVINNTGSIVGNVFLEEDDDFFSNAGGGTVSGVIEGFDGEDTIIGGIGADEIDGGDDNDVLRGAAGDDLIFGGEGEDTISGGDGDDTIEGDAGNEDIFGGAGEDSILGGKGTDNLRGNGGSDYIDGGDELDLLRGGDGNDTLIGGEGNDTLNGGAGDDEITAGLGKDVMRGNRGEDVFIFTDALDSTTSAVDRIRDFQSGQDLIDLSAIATFDFIGSAAFSGTGAEVRFQTTGSGLRFDVDVDGDGSADMRVNMNNISVLTVEDFIL